MVSLSNHEGARHGHGDQRRGPRQPYSQSRSAASLSGVRVLRIQVARQRHRSRRVPGEAVERAAADHPLHARPALGLPRRERRVVRGRRRSASVTASSIAIAAPCAANGVIACAASPISAKAPASVHGSSNRDRVDRPDRSSSPVSIRRDDLRRRAADRPAEQRLASAVRSSLSPRASPAVTHDEVDACRRRAADRRSCGWIGCRNAVTLFCSIMPARCCRPLRRRDRGAPGDAAGKAALPVCRPGRAGSTTRRRRRPACGLSLRRPRRRDRSKR